MLANLSFLVFIFSVLALLAYIILDFLKTRSLIKTLHHDLQKKDQEISALSKQTNDLNEQLHGQEKHIQQALSDPVTSLIGWQLFQDRLKQSLQESTRYQFNISLMSFDINNFNVINEALGFEKADLLLQEVGKRLKQCIRQTDSLTRHRNDNFIILLTQLNKPETAAIVAQRMIQAMKEPFYLQNEEIFITCRIGIVIFPTDGNDITSLLRNAEQAQIDAKQKGGNVYQFYQKGMQLKSQRELAMHTSLSRERIFQELIMYYQPIYNTESKRIFGLEAMLHWQHPQLGRVHSDELYAYASKHHKENLLSEWLLENACKKYLKWNKREGAHLVVPFSIKQLDNVHFIYRISKILQDVGFAPEHLIIEINEAAASLPIDVLEKAFNMLDYLGVKIAINNFATEPFLLSRLQFINVSYVKLSAHITHAFNRNERGKHLLKATLDFVKQLKAEIIVDGVEDETISRSLQKLGCYLQQGQYFYDTMPEAEIDSDKFTSTVVD